MGNKVAFMRYKKFLVSEIRLKVYKKLQCKIKIQNCKI